MKIGRPECQWISLPNIDKRRAAIWLCKACGAMRKSRAQPECACSEIELSQDT